MPYVYLNQLNINHPHLQQLMWKNEISNNKKIIRRISNKLLLHERLFLSIALCVKKNRSVDTSCCDGDERFLRDLFYIIVFFLAILVKYLAAFMLLLFVCCRIFLYKYKHIVANAFEQQQWHMWAENVNEWIIWAQKWGKNLEVEEHLHVSVGWWDVFSSLLTRQIRWN